MGNIQEYKILYTETALADIEEKADYITFQFQDPFLAERWYLQLREQIVDSLSTFPYKYPCYDAAPWREKGVRFFVTRSDVVLYTVDDTIATVWIWAVCTKGRDLSTHLENTDLVD